MSTLHKVKAYFGMAPMEDYDDEYYEEEQGPFFQFMGEEGDPVYITPDEIGDGQAAGNLVVGFTDDQTLVAEERWVDLELRSTTGPAGGKAFMYYDWPGWREVPWSWAARGSASRTLVVPWSGRAGTSPGR